MGKPNYEHLDDNVKALVELRAALAEAKAKPNTYENNLKVQILTRQIEDVLSLPEVKPQIIS